MRGGGHGFVGTGDGQGGDKCLGGKLTGGIPWLLGMPRGVIWTSTHAGGTYFGA